MKFSIQVIYPKNPFKDGEMIINGSATSYKEAINTIKQELALRGIETYRLVRNHILEKEFSAQKLGKKGGDATKAKHPQHFKTISQKGVQARWGKK